jgi:hypothetical protein
MRENLSLGRRTTIDRDAGVDQARESRVLANSMSETVFQNGRAEAVFNHVARCSCGDRRDTCAVVTGLCNEDDRHADPLGRYPGEQVECRSRTGAMIDDTDVEIATDEGSETICHCCDSIDDVPAGGDPIGQASEHVRHDASIVDDENAQRT